ncbi:MAG: hypothetical protein H0U08_11865 [Actinobacteria bacterium]|nr:hypothetical protein [Actinomycetota bacterium]
MTLVEEDWSRFRHDTQSIGAAALTSLPDPAIEKAVSRYAHVVMNTLAACYLVAYNEEWEGLDAERLTALVESAVHQYREPEDGADRAYMAAIGLATDAQEFRVARELLESLPSVSRMGYTLRYILERNAELPHIKRRHRDDFGRTCVHAAGVGSALGVLDRIDFLPSGQPVE